MIACLQIEETAPKGIIGRLFGGRRSERVKLRIASACAADYLIVTASVTARRGVDWDEVYKLTRPRADCLLLPDGIRPPPDFPLQRPRFPRFERQVLLDTACELIRRTGLPMYRRVLGFVDEDGSCAWLLEHLLKFYTSVRVVTGNLPLYRDVAERMMDTLGAPVPVGSALDGFSFSDCALVLAPGNLPAEFRAEYTCPLLVGGVAPMLPVRNDVFSGLEVVSLKNTDEAIPVGIMFHEFAGALYEYHNAAFPALVAERLLYNNKRSSLREAVYAVLRAAGFPAGV